jgi:molecular chaperone GrpE
MKNSKANNNKAAAEGETVTMPKAEYELLKTSAAERDASQEKLLRIQADYENARRRMEKDKAEFLKFANEGFALDLLPILDNLEMAEKHIKEAKDFKAVQEGIDMIQLQIQKFVKDVGLERIKTVGEKFDPHLHEAFETIESPDGDDGVITAELKPGYRLNGKLLRPAVVKIIKRKGG